MTEDDDHLRRWVNRQGKPRRFVWRTALAVMIGLSLVDNLVLLGLGRPQYGGWSVGILVFTAVIFAHNVANLVRDKRVEATRPRVLAVLESGAALPFTQVFLGDSEGFPVWVAIPPVVPAGERVNQVSVKMTRGTMMHYPHDEFWAPWFEGER